MDLFDSLVFVYVFFFFFAYCIRGLDQGIGWNDMVELTFLLSTPSLVRSIYYLFFFTDNFSLLTVLALQIQCWIKLKSSISINFFSYKLSY